MNINVYATSPQAAKSLLSLGLIGLEICDQAGNEGLEQALSSIKGLSVVCENGDNGFECKIGDIESSAVLDSTATIEIDCGSSDKRIFSISPSQGRTIEDVVKTAMEGLNEHMHPVPTQDNTPQL